MAIKAILFDLDGTLLPMDQDLFIKIYLKNLAKWMAPKGYAPEKMIKAVWQGSDAMVKNDGSITNEQRFWDSFTSDLGEGARNEEENLESFYLHEFDKVAEHCGFDPMANEAVKELKKMGYRLALATNPLFPKVATEARVRWAGLDISDFELVTTYENSSYCKPSLEYYISIIKKMGLPPYECLMVGNDVDDDMVAEKLGMQVFLIPRCLINKSGTDISCYSKGDFSQLIEFVKNQE